MSADYEANCVDALKADFRAHGHEWNYDPSAYCPRLRAFVDGATLFAYPNQWNVSFDPSKGLSDVEGGADSYADAQRRAHLAYTSLKGLSHP